MQTVLEKNALLERAERLNRERRYQNLTKLLQPIRSDELVRVPELGHLLAVCFKHTGQTERATRLVLAMSKTADRWSQERIYRRHRNLHGVLLLEQGNLLRAESMFMDVLGASERAADQYYIALATMHLGIIADIRCEWQNAIADYNRSLAAFLRLGETVSIANCHHNLGMAYRQIGRFTDADSHFGLAIEYHHHRGIQAEMLATLGERALLRNIVGDHACAEAAVSAALADASKTNDVGLVGELLRVLGIVQRARKQPAVARESFLLALKHATTAGAELLRAELYEELTAVSVDLNDSPSVRRYYLEKSVVLYQQLGAEKRSANVSNRFGV